MDRIDAAVKWWSEKVSSRVHHENGDKSSSGRFSMALADFLVQPVTDEQKVIFEAELKKELTEKYKEWGDYLVVGVDYSPDLPLINAAEKAGINTMNFPFKTYMSFRDNRLSVREGYGAQPVTIWEEGKVKEWSGIRKDGQKDRV